MDTRSLLSFLFQVLIDTVIIVSEKNSTGFTIKTKRDTPLNDEIKYESYFSRSVNITEIK